MVEDLSDEQAGKLFKAILNYVNSSEYNLTQSTPERTAFLSIKSQIDVYTEKYLQKCAQNSKNAKKRYEKPKTTTECERMHNDIDNDIESDNENYMSSVELKNNKTKYNIHLPYNGEYENIQLSQREYNALIKHLKRKSIGKAEEFYITGINTIIDELSTNLASGKENIDNTKHAEILHKYINQKYTPRYIHQFGDFDDMINKEIANPDEVIF